MKGLLPAAGLVLAAFVACQSGNGGSASSDGGATSGCPCVVTSDGGGTVTLPCRVISCAFGDAYLCQANGAVEYQGPCVTDSEGGLLGEACAPSCPAGQCGVSDQCGGLCGCSGSLKCVAGTCGNGCSLGAGAYCTPGATTPCCAEGESCSPDDAGVNVCCTVTGAGVCTVDTDCCDYPNVHCVTVKNDAGAFVSHGCQ